MPSHKLRGATGISAEVHGKPLNVSGKMSGRKPRKSLETREGGPLVLPGQLLLFPNLDGSACP